MSKTVPVYPVLALSRDGSITPVERPEHLGRCNARAFWRNGYYDRLILIDSAWNIWRATGAELSMPLGLIRRAVARVTNARLDVIVALELEESAVEPDMARDLVGDWLETNTVFWEASADLEEWRASIESCSTLEELATLFS